MRLSAGRTIGTMLMAAGVVVAAGCSGQPTDRADLPSLIETEALSAFPMETVEDWVSYGDAAVVARVTAEHELPLVSEDGADEGTIGRRVSVRVEEQLWLRPGAEAPPKAITYTSTGWFVRDGDRVPMAIAGETREEVGQRYLLVLVKDPGSEWYSAMATPFDAEGGSAGLRVSAGVADDTVLLPDGSEAPGARALVAGRTPDDVAALLRRTEPDPIAAEYDHLPAIERYEAVARERYPATGGPAEVEGDLDGG